MSKNKVTTKKYKFKHLPGYDPYADSEGYYFDYDEGIRAVSFIEKFIKLTKAEWKGKPFILEDWQKDFIICLFGWFDELSKLRRYSTVFVYVPRKNGKSQLIAAIACYCFFCDEENDAEIYIGARDRGQALTLWKMVESMIKQNDDLWEKVDSHKTEKEIRARWDDSIIKAISSDALSQHSSMPSVAIIDELHAQRDDKLIEALETGQGSRENPLMIYITTADLDRPSICNEELERAQSVRDGVTINADYLPIIFETPKDADWKDEETWKKANPTYPITPKRDFLIKKCNAAKNSPRKESSFKRLYLNMKTNTIEGWLNMDYWRLCAEDFDENDLKGQDCYIGFDLASKIDLTSMIAYFPEGGHLVDRFYAPDLAIYNDVTGHYQEWKDFDYITCSGEKTTDYRYMIEDIKLFRELFNIKCLCFDPHNANILIAMLEEMFEKEIEEDENFLLEFKQTYTNYNESSKEFERKIIEGEMRHNSPILDWMAANVVIREGPSGDIMPQKPKRNSPLKIDGIAASVMALGGWMMHNDQEDENVYEDRGLLIL
jgi:phage terminase large subunit-like protein